MATEGRKRNHDWTPLEKGLNLPDDSPRMRPVRIVQVRILHPPALSRVYSPSLAHKFYPFHITLKAGPVQSRKGKEICLQTSKPEVVSSPIQSKLRPTPLAPGDGTLIEDELEEGDLKASRGTAGLIGRYLSHVGVGVGVENFNPMYKLRDMGRSSSTTSLASTHSLDLDLSLSSPIVTTSTTAVFNTVPTIFVFTGHGISIVTFIPSFFITCIVVVTVPLSDMGTRTNPLVALGLVFNAAPFGEDIGVTDCTEGTECVSCEEDWRSRQGTKSRPRRRDEREDFGERVRLNGEGGRDSESCSDREPDEETLVQEEVVVEGEELGMVLERELDKAGRGER
ncbi:hypothetical protein PQX77_019868 [Marasmius sp. AFHP31]|nr:hypothetical protein PQX77_019868 [Marasmius sp. AFHP31]